MKMINPNLPPFPRIGEILRTLSQALDTKAKNRDVDRLARGDDIDWALAPQLIIDLFQSPLRKYGDEAFADFVSHFVTRLHAEYIQMVVTISLDSLSRAEALPLLVEHWFALNGAEFIYMLRQKFGGPDLMQLFDAERNPFCTVFAWLSAEGGACLAKAAFPQTTGTDKNGREMVARWEQGGALPDIGNIGLFLVALTKYGAAEQKGKVADLRRWLLVARAVCWFEREAMPSPLRSIMCRHALNGFPATDVGKVLSLAVLAGGASMGPLTVQGLMLSENLKRTTPKVVGDQAKTQSALLEFDRALKEFDPEERARYLLAWLQGRWQILSGDYIAALPHYKAAVALANYRAGANLRQIIEEALALAGHQHDMVFLRQLKHHAIAFGLFMQPANADGPSFHDWEVDQFRQSFTAVFPPLGRFIEAVPATGMQQEWPVLLLDMAEIDSRQPDLRNPDRVVSVKSADGQIRRWSQLRLFASFGRVDAVRILLERGASVDWLDQSGGSALMCAIQFAEEGGDRRAMDLLLAVPHTKATLDSLTNKKQHSPLFCAIESGDPDVVARLLAMGASADLRGRMTDQTPLYFCMEKMAQILHPAKAHQFFDDYFIQDSDAFQREIRRRAGGIFGNVFGGREGLDRLLGEPNNRKRAESLISIMMKIDLERHSIPKLLRIVELLLEYGANPNAYHEYPVPGRTPLMLAAEENSVAAFDGMVKRGGDPYRKDKQESDCLRIAFSFGARDVMAYCQRGGMP
jgi:hypothetical protein